VSDHPPPPAGATDATTDPQSVVEGSTRDVVIELPEHLRRLRDHIAGAFPLTDALSYRGELTLVVEPDQIVDLLTFCRDDPDVRCELLADLHAVHWPGGPREVNAQETTGWPTYTETREGRIEVDYILRSLTHGHVFRVRTSTDDRDPVVPSVTDVYASANFMEREAYDLMGVTFAGHPNLVRILMPEDWEGHPHRKDYPLGGVEVMYQGKTVPPPDERDY